MAVVETSGLSDRILYSQVMTNLGKAYAQYGVGDGKSQRRRHSYGPRAVEYLDAQQP